MASVVAMGEVFCEEEKGWLNRGLKEPGSPGSLFSKSEDGLYLMEDFGRRGSFEQSTGVLKKTSCAEKTLENDQNIRPGCDRTHTGTFLGERVQVWAGG